MAERPELQPIRDRTIEGSSQRLGSYEPQQAEIARVRDAEPKASDGSRDLSALESEHLKRRLTLEEIFDIAQNRVERKAYAACLYWLVAVWLLQGFGFRSFGLSDVVLGTLIGSTSVSVIGLFATVSKYLFPKRSTALVPRTVRNLKTGTGN